MREETRRTREDLISRPQAPRMCGKIFPLPGEMPRETPHEFANGIAASTGEILLALGPEGDLYYTTLNGDGQVHKIVVHNR